MGKVGKRYFFMTFLSIYYAALLLVQRIVERGCWKSGSGSSHSGIMSNKSRSHIRIIQVVHQTLKNLFRQAAFSLHATIPHLLYPSPSSPYQSQPPFESRMDRTSLIVAIANCGGGDTSSRMTLEVQASHN